LSRDGSNKATIAAFLAQQARSFEISLPRARNQERRFPIIALKIGIRTEVVKKLNFRWYGRRWKRTS
jgi:hypothetical protein